MTPANRRRVLLGAAALLLLLLLGFYVEHHLLADRFPHVAAAGGEDTARRAGDSSDPSGTGGTDGETTEEEEARAPGPIVDPPKKEAEEEATAPNGSPLVPPAAVEAKAEDEPPANVAGRVVDAATGKPVAEARVLLGITGPDGDDRGWYGDWTKEDGTFGFPLREQVVRDSGRKAEEVDLKGLRVDLRVRAAGYEKARIRAPGAETVVRLAPDLPPPLPGTVRGVVTKADGTAFQGRLKIESLENECGWYACQWTYTDETGNYELAGVPAGSWQMRISASGEFQTVVVPEGGEAWLPLRMTGDRVDEGSDRMPAEVRAVRITGIPADAPGGSMVRAETRPGHFFRAPVAGGTARFPSLPLHGYRFVLERPGLEGSSVEAEVVRGEGEQAVAFARKE